MRWGETGTVLREPSLSQKKSPSMIYFSSLKALFFILAIFIDYLHRSTVSLQLKYQLLLEPENTLHRH